MSNRASAGPDIPPMPSGGDRGGLLYGAAYRAVVDRLPVMPDNCGPDEWPTLQAVVGRIAAWVAEQDEPLRTAYRHAIHDILSTAGARVENVRRAMLLAGAYEAIPKPPL
jgi:hypothetical protein